MTADHHAYTTPLLEPGMNVIDVPTPRSPALHQLTHETLTRTDDNNLLWVDARNTAITFRLHHPATSRRFIRGRIARAFTAYQHHELIRTLPHIATPSTPLIVAPCFTSLYHDDDIPEPEDAAYLRSSTAILAELGHTLNIPILVSCTHMGPLREIIAEYATTSITVEPTTEGYRYETDEFTTLIYWHQDYWQTTIPYWVELFGAVTDESPVDQLVAHQRATV